MSHEPRGQGIEAVLDVIQTLLGWQLTGLWSEDATRDIVIGLGEYYPARVFWETDSIDEQTAKYDCELSAQIRLAGYQDLELDFPEDSAAAFVAPALSSGAAEESVEGVEGVSVRRPDLYSRVLMVAFRHSFDQAGMHVVNIVTDGGPNLSIVCAGIQVSGVIAASG